MNLPCVDDLTRIRKRSSASQAPGPMSLARNRAQNPIARHRREFEGTYGMLSLRSRRHARTDVFSSWPRGQTSRRQTWGFCTPHFTRGPGSTSSIDPTNMGCLSSRLLMGNTDWGTLYPSTEASAALSQWRALLTLRPHSESGRILAKPAGRRRSNLRRSFHDKGRLHSKPTARLRQIIPSSRSGASFLVAMCRLGE